MTRDTSPTNPTPCPKPPERLDNKTGTPPMLMDVPRIGLGVDVPAGCNRTGESREESNRRVQQYPLHVTGR